MSLGGYNEVVTDHDTGRTISLSLSASTQKGKSDFRLGIGQSGGQSSIDVAVRDAVETSLGYGLDGRFRSSLDIPFPYQSNQSDMGSLIIDDGGEAIESSFSFEWNGISVSAVPGQSTNLERVADLLTTINFPMELARATGFVPLRRGFSRPTYTVSNVTPALATEVEVASLLATDRFLEYAVGDYLERVAERRIASRTQMGTSTFTIDSIPRDGDVPVSMVNEGFGVNQLSAHAHGMSVFQSHKIVAIEEPEIHLHPSMVRNLAKRYGGHRIQARQALYRVHTQRSVFVLVAAGPDCGRRGQRGRQSRSSSQIRRTGRAGSPGRRRCRTARLKEDSTRSLLRSSRTLHSSWGLDTEVASPS